MVRALLHRLLVDGLQANSRDIEFERPAPEVRGRIDALLGRTVFELKSDLRRERADAEEGLTRYLTDREGQTGEKYVGIATDGADFIAFFPSTRSCGRGRLSPYRAGDAARVARMAPMHGRRRRRPGTGPETITREFGRESLAARRALDGLTALWNDAGQSPVLG